MTNLKNQLEVDRCPHCNIDKPNLVTVQGSFETHSHSGVRRAFWHTYRCVRCGGVVLASSLSSGEGEVDQIYPKATTVHEAIPEPANRYLKQAIETQHSPDGSIVLSASAVDAMLKIKNYKRGSLYSRINRAAKDHLITQEMAKWAHEVRLDANDQRHADEDATPPTPEDARRCIDFVLALGELLFVLPSRVKRGLADVSKPSDAP